MFIKQLLEIFSFSHFESDDSGLLLFEFCGFEDVGTFLSSLSGL